MTDDGVRAIWSDRELDIALATLRSEVDIDASRMASTRAELLEAAGAAEPADGVVPDEVPVVEPAVRRRSWWVASAAAVVLVVAVVLVAQLVRGEENPPAANPVELLEQAAANASDEPVGPGQYRLISRHAWTVAPSIDGDEMIDARRTEAWGKVWIPQNWREDWMNRGACVQSFTLPDGVPDNTMCDQKPYEIVMPCGAVNESEIAEWCDKPGSWGSPNPLFFDSVTRDPDTMRDQMIADYDADLRDFFPDGIPDAERISPEEKVMRTAKALLRPGEAPADVRAVVYRMIARLPGLRVTDPDASLDGRRGVGFGIDFDPVRLELVIEPSTGEFIGLRDVYLRTDRLIPAGTEGSFSVSTTVVDGIGQEPS